jgi:hypothetical protein
VVPFSWGLQNNTVRVRLTIANIFRPSGYQKTSWTGLVFVEKKRDLAGPENERGTTCGSSFWELQDNTVRVRLTAANIDGAIGNVQHLQDHLVFVSIYSIDVRRACMLCLRLLLRT